MNERELNEVLLLHRLWKSDCLTHKQRRRYEKLLNKYWREHGKQ